MTHMQSSQVVCIVLFPVDWCAVAPVVVVAAVVGAAVATALHLSVRSDYLNFKIAQIEWN